MTPEVFLLLLLSRYGLRNFPQVRNAGLWIQSREAGDRWEWQTSARPHTHTHTIKLIFCVHFCSFWCLYLCLPAGSDSLLDKIQKAAEVVASAVLPPTEHQGIRLHENHYRAVVAPSAPIEVAMPACAYNVPSRKPKGETLLVWWKHWIRTQNRRPDSWCSVKPYSDLIKNVYCDTLNYPVSSPQHWPSGAQGRLEAAGKRLTAATAPLTTPLRISQLTAGPLWAASQLVPRANRRPVERAVVTYQKGEWQC